MEPSGKTCFSSERMNFLVDLQEDLLNDLQAFFPVQGDSIGDAKKLILVSPDKNTECLLMPFFEERNQSLLIPMGYICFIRHQLY